MILLARAIHEVNQRKRQREEEVKPEFLLKSVLRLQQKEKLIHEIQHPKIQPYKTDPEQFKDLEYIPHHVWNDLANLDAPLYTYDFRKNLRKQMPDVETNAGPVKSIMLILLILITTGYAQEIPYESSYNPAIRGLPSQICLIQRNPNITGLKQYATSNIKFWMNHQDKLIYLPYSAKFTKPDHSDLLCTTCSKTKQNNCNFTQQLHQSEWIISTNQDSESCEIKLINQDIISNHTITINPTSSNLLLIPDAN